LDLVVSAIGQIRDCPTGVDEDFVVEGVYELGKNSERWGNLEKKTSDED
jgi:hypothetical protein